VLRFSAERQPDQLRAIMDHRYSKTHISGLGDVELIRLLTEDARHQTPEVIAIATAEANRRGLPIDERFIPSRDDESTSSEEPSPRRFAVGNVPLRCSHCGGDRFAARDVLLNTRGLTFLKLDWLNRSAKALVCAKCTAIHWFAAGPVAVDDQE
jgi:hypothetical protein